MPVKDDSGGAGSASGRRLLLLDERDNVAVALTKIARGEQVEGDGFSVRATAAIPLGHKIAVRPIAAGEKVVKYGASIGSATCDIAPGDHVHIHNLRSDYIPTYTRGGDNPFTETD